MIIIICYQIVNTVYLLLINIYALWCGGDDDDDVVVVVVVVVALEVVEAR